jgi:type II restriction enzyme
MKGNKGEWSELYTFFKLLAEGKLFSADENLEKTASFVELLSIYRKDSGGNLNFQIKDDNLINIIDANTNMILLSFPKSEAESIAQNLLNDLNSETNPSIELIDLIKKYHITQVADKSSGKGDIDILIFDPVHGISSNQEFSIKSFLGSDPTLFNANKTTNIVYKITDVNNAPITDEHLNEVNSIETSHKYIDRIAKLTDLGYNIKFHSYDDSTFKLNLQVIDSDLPEIIAHIVKDKYVSRLSKFQDVITKITEDNPMNYDLSQGHAFYEYKLVKFLVESALGMTSKSVWSGKYDIVGGIIIVKPDAEILCYHLIDFNKFKQYLKNSARLDNPSGSKMGYGKVFFEGSNSYIKLNFQIKG